MLELITKKNRICKIVDVLGKNVMTVLLNLTMSVDATILTKNLFC